MNAAGWLEALPVLLPLAAAVLAFVLGRLGSWLALASGLGQLVTASALAVRVATAGPYRAAVGGHEAPPGIALLIDGPGVWLLLVSAVLGTAVVVRAWRWAEDERPSFWPLWLVASSGIAAICVAGDLFNAYVALEVLGLAAVGLVALGDDVAAAVRYLLVSMLGSLAWLLGVALVYDATGTLDLLTVGSLLDGGPAVPLASGAMLSGVLLKTAVFPLHAWLPPAHGSAPSPVSALLSGVVVKATVLLAFRLWTQVFPGLADGATGTLVGGLGAAAIAWGSIQALRAPKLKLLVAYSTVAQLGYLFLVFPLLGGAEVLPALWLLVAAHALAKGGMFLAAGELLAVLGHDRMSELRGLWRRLPVAMLAFGVSGVTLMGLPPSGAFVAKWWLIEAAVLHGWPGIVLALLGGSFLAAAYVFRVLERGLLTPDEAVGPVRWVGWTALLLALGALALGPLAWGPLAVTEAVP